MRSSTLVRKWISKNIVKDLIGKYITEAIQAIQLCGFCFPKFGFLRRCRGHHRLNRIELCVWVLARALQPNCQPEQFKT